MTLFSVIEDTCGFHGLLTGRCSNRIDPVLGTLLA
jgi:hypothetical protein